MSLLQIYNCGNLEEIANSIVITSKEQDIINSMGDKLQLLYDNKIEKDTQEHIKHAFINIFHKIFNNHKGGKKGGDDNNADNNDNDNDGDDGDDNKLIIKESNTNNFSLNDFFMFVQFIVGIFLIAISLLQFYKFCDSLSLNEVIEELKNTINGLTNDEMSYVSYVWNILTGTTANILIKNEDYIMQTVNEELKDFFVKTDEAFKHCSIENSDSIIGIITNIFQLCLRPSQTSECIYDYRYNKYMLEHKKMINDMTLLYKKKFDNILTIRDMLKYGLGFTITGGKYFVYRYYQIKNNRQQHIAGGRKTKKRKINKRKTNKRKTNKKYM